MATSLKFEDENSSMCVFVNQFDKIVVEISNDNGYDEFSIIQLENEDVRKLINELNKLLKINK